MLKLKSLRKLIAGFKIAFWNLGALIPLVYLFVTCPLMSLSRYWPNDRTITTFLSVQTQILATILGLVFTTTLVVAQLAARYSQHVLRHVLGTWIFYYFIPYLVGIALPLFLLYSNTFKLWVGKFSLLLGGFCLALLIPYFVVLRHLLSLDSLIQEMENEMAYSKDSLIQEMENETPDSKLLNLAMGALKHYDYTSFEQAMNAVKNVGEKINSLSPLRNELTLIARRELRDPRAPFKAIDTLRELGYVAIQRKLEDDTKQFLKALYKVAKEATREDIPDVAAYAVGAFGLVSERAIKKELWKAFISVDEQSRNIFYETIRLLQDIGERATEKSMDEVLQAARQALRQIAKTGIEVAKQGDGKGESSRLVKKTIEAMGEVIQTAIKKGCEETDISQLIRDFSGIGVEAIKAGLGSIVHQTISTLQTIRVPQDADNLYATVGWVYVQLVKELGERTMGEEWERQCLARIAKYLTGKEVNDAISRKAWGQMKTIATGLGKTGQIAFDKDDSETGKVCYEGLKSLAEAILDASTAPDFPNDAWVKDSEKGAGWSVAAGLGFVAQRAATRRLKEVVEGSLELLEKISDAARENEGWDTVHQVDTAMGYIAEALAERSDQ
jgi:hypothetical protein